MAQYIIDLESENEHSTETTNLLWLMPMTLIVAVLTAVAAFFGLRGIEVYSNSVSFAAQGQGQDVVTLALVLPVLLVTGWMAARGSIRARVIWLGAMVYIAYTYAIAAFQVEFNSLFLVYVGALGTSFYSILFALFDHRLTVFTVPKPVPVRVIAVILGGLALMYYALWLQDVIKAIASGTVPPQVVQDNLPTSSVEVLDMGFVLPMMLLAAVWLWQRKPMGFVLSGTGLSFGLFMGAAVVAMLINLFRLGIAESLTPLVIFAVTTLLMGSGLVMLLRGGESGEVVTG